ncbi:hypothetical protein FVE85_2612 [Porphyridium purpureum]|uniref:Uncharacterized protein n=1 Tax=Porphyridium purpureum TaxID=35688 RepID=A0A5J4YS96_PORPP|nr:hypothetical protein FVE85_2612 [Porphyridium purpureum]|eukprot:POR9516..scf227_4
MGMAFTPLYVADVAARIARPSPRVRSQRNVVRRGANCAGRASRLAASLNNNGERTSRRSRPLRDDASLNELIDALHEYLDEVALDGSERTIDELRYDVLQARGRVDLARGLVNHGGFVVVAKQMQGVQGMRAESAAERVARQQAVEDNRVRLVKSMPEAELGGLALGRAREARLEPELVQRAAMQAKQQLEDRSRYGEDGSSAFPLRPETNRVAQQLMDRAGLSFKVRRRDELTEELEMQQRQRPREQMLFSLPERASMVAFVWFVVLAGRADPLHAVDLGDYATYAPALTQALHAVAGISTVGHMGIAVLAARIAARKNRNPSVWAAKGFLSGAVALQKLTTLRPLPRP